MPRFQSTPPVKAATVPLGTGTLSLYISIHAAREGGDHDQQAANAELRTISIHAAREGGDAGSGTARCTRGKFQSTPPVKAATRR